MNVFRFGLRNYMYSEAVPNESLLSGVLGGTNPAIRK